MTATGRENLTRDILSAIASGKNTTQQLVTLLSVEGAVSDHDIYSRLNRLVSNGSITRIGKGVYALQSSSQTEQWAAFKRLLDALPPFDKMWYSDEKKMWLQAHAELSAALASLCNGNDTATPPAGADSERGTA